MSQEAILSRNYIKRNSTEVTSPEILKRKPSGNDQGSILISDVFLGTGNWHGTIAFGCRAISILIGEIR